MLDYRTFVKNGSRPNTPPVFAIYILNLVCRWIADRMGGLGCEERQRAVARELGRQGA
jgi:phosphoserine aminotransferase